MGGVSRCLMSGELLTLKEALLTIMEGELHFLTVLYKNNNALLFSFLYIPMMHNISIAY